MTTPTTERQPVELEGLCERARSAHHRHAEKLAQAAEERRLADLAKRRSEDRALLDNALREVIGHTLDGLLAAGVELTHEEGYKPYVTLDGLRVGATYYGHLLQLVLLDECVDCGTVEWPDDFAPFAVFRSLIQLGGILDDREGGRPRRCAACHEVRWRAEEEEREHAKREAPISEVEPVEPTPLEALRAAFLTWLEHEGVQRWSW